MITSRAEIGLFDDIIIDSFAGGGGASTGIELATGHPVDIAINHSESAIMMHKINHPYDFVKVEWLRLSAFNQKTPACGSGRKRRWK